jgi:hypothetical protein
MNGEFKPENPELLEICMKHGSILAKREKVTQIAILDLYDDVLKLTSSNSDYTKCPKCKAVEVENLGDGSFGCLICGEHFA